MSKRFVGKFPGLLCIMLVLILTLSLFAGCGSGSPDGSNASGSNAATGTSSEQKLSPYEIKAYIPNPPQKDLELVTAELNKQLQQKINATIKVNMYGFDSYQDKVNLAIASGEPFDVCFTANWMQYSQNVAKNAFTEITDEMLDKYAPQTKANTGRFLDFCKVGDKMYAIPTEKEFAAYYGLVAKKELVDKYNLDLTKIKTMADIEPMLKTVKDGEPDIYPFYVYKNGTPVGLLLNMFEMIDGSNLPGVLRRNTDYKVYNQYEEPEYKEALKVARDWFQKGYINKNAATITDTSPDEKGGKFLFELQVLKPGKDNELAQSYGYPLTQTAFPSDVKPYTSCNEVQNSMMAISRTSEDKERALMFIDLLHNDSQLINTFAFGIENKHYVKKSDNVIDFADGLNATSTGYSMIGMQWTLGNQLIEYTWTNEDPDKAQKLKEFNNDAIESKISGFSFNSEPVKTEQAAISNVVKQYVQSLESGSVDVDSVYPKFISALKAAGVDKLIAEKQKQIDEWAAANGKK